MLWKRLSSSVLPVILLLSGCQEQSFKADLVSPEVEVRVRAIEFLGSQRDRDAIPRLSEALRDSVVEVRAKAAWALGMLQAKGSVIEVCALLGDSEPRVRQSASRALMQMEEPDALPALREALGGEPDEWVRKDLEEAIAHLGQFEGESDLGEASFR